MARREVHMAFVQHYLVFLAIYGYSCLAQQFVLHPSDSVYKIGEEAILKCGLSSTPGISSSHHWIRGDPQTYVSRGTSIYDANVDATRYSVAQEGGVFILRIANLKPSDKGSYFCAIYNGEWVNSEKASLEIITEWPRPTCTTDPQRAQIKDPVSFLCRLPTSAMLNLPLTWTYIDANFGGTKIMKPGETFSVEWTVKEKDNYGYFSCYVGRPTGHGEACVDTPLKIPPKPQVVPESRTKIVGENVEFDCVPGIQHPNVTLYTWFTQGSDGYHEYTKTVGRFRVREGGKNLKIRNVTLADNEMEVWCKAQNNLGINAEADVKSIVYVTKALESTTRIETSSIKAPADVSTDTNNIHSTPTITSTNQTNADIILKPESTSNVSGIIVGGTIAGILLLIIIIILTLYLVKSRNNSKSIIPVSVEPKKDNTNRYSKIIMRPLSVFKERRDSQSASSPSTEDPDILYSLPLQRGGGTMRVKPLIFDLNHDKEPPKIAQISPSVNYKKTRNATLPAGLRRPSALKVGSKSPASSRAKSLSTSVTSLEADSDYVLYSLSSKRGGGTVKIKSRNASLDNLDSVSQNSRSNSRLNLANLQTDDDALYAPVAFDGSSEHNPSSRDSGRYSEYTNVHISSGSLYDLHQQHDEHHRDSNYANVHIGPDDGTYGDVNAADDYRPPDSPYVNMTGGTGGNKSEPESEYVEADFASVGSFSFDSSFDDDLDYDPQDKNVEGLVYAHVNVENNQGEQEKQIIGHKNKTVYADISKLL